MLPSGVGIGLLLLNFGWLLLTFYFCSSIGGGGEGVVRPKAIQVPDGIVVCGYYLFFLFVFRAC